MAALGVIRTVDSYAYDLSGARAQARMNLMMDETNLSVEIRETAGRIIRENGMRQSHFGLGERKGVTLGNALACLGMRGDSSSN